MLMILLFSPSATSFVIGCLTNRTPRLRPGYAHLLDAMSRKLDARDLGVEVRFKLARVQMPPRPLLGMIESGQLGTAVRTRPSHRIVLQPQVDALRVDLQLNPSNVPRRGDPQNRLEQFRVLQRRSPAERLYQQDTSTSTRRRAGRPSPAAARAGGLTNHPDPL